MASPFDVDILIIGAGPTGLSTALHLIHNPDPPRLRIVDKNTTPGSQSRALVVQSRTLEMLAQHRAGPAAADVASALQARGQYFGGLSVYVNRRRSLMTDLAADMFADTAFPLPLFVTQNETESVLADSLRSYDIEIERGVGVEDMREVDGGCEAVLVTSRGGDGQQQQQQHERVRARYVVGCDGAHSMVRHAAGIPFLGSSYPNLFILADAYIDWESIKAQSEHANSIILTWGRRISAIFPIRDSAVRLVSVRPPGGGGDAAAPPEPPTVADFQEILDENVGPGVATVRDAFWLANFRLHHRGVDAYRRGRFFLAGDAAHIHSPVGGQGMNTGIQDGANLGWKLALVVKREREREAGGGGSGGGGGLVSQYPADQALLDSYNEERRPIGDRLLRTTDRLFEYATSGNWFVRLFRNFWFRWVFPWVMTRPARRRAALSFFTQLRIRYSSGLVGMASSLAAAPVRGGDRAPDFLVKEVGGGVAGADRWIIRDTGLGGRHCLVLFAGHCSDSDEAVKAVIDTVMAAFDASTAAHVLIRVVKAGTRASTGTGGGTPAADWWDQTGRAHLAYGFGSRAGYVLVRPDGYVAHIGTVEDRVELAAWLKTYPPTAE